MYSGGSSVDHLDQHGESRGQNGGSRGQHPVNHSPKLTTQEQQNSSQHLTVLVDSKEIANPQVCLNLISLEWSLVSCAVKYNSSEETILEYDTLIRILVHGPHKLSTVYVIIHEVFKILFLRL